MADCYLGEIRLFAMPTTRETVGFVPCDGRLLPIKGNEALYSLLGVMYGGDGKTTFAVPNLQGRVPVHRGAITGDTPAVTYAQGAAGGFDAVALDSQNMPSHNHNFMVSTTQATALTPDPTMTYGAVASGYLFYTTAGQNGTATTFNGDTVETAFVPGGAAHNNIQPTYYLNYFIATYGFYPST